VTQEITLNENEDRALKNYTKSLEKLRKLKIIRSKNITGDIGEFLAMKLHPGLILVDRKNNPGYDALDPNEKKYQIKYSDSKESENIDLGDPSEYDYLIIILGSNSKHKLDDDGLYSPYTFSSADLKDHWPRTPQGHYTLTKNKLVDFLKILESIHTSV